MNRKTASDLLYIAFGVVLAGFALRGFLIPNGFLDGGVTGVSLLVHEFSHINIAWVIMALNAPFIIFGYRLINPAFAINSAVAIIAFGTCLLFIPYPVITSDKLLVSIFGGVFLGLGAGLTMRGGAAIDGIEVLALYTGRRLAFTTSEIILGLNIALFAIAALALGLQTALYSTLTYYAASRMTNFVVDGVEEYTNVVVVSRHAEEIKAMMVNELQRGITVYKGERGFLPGAFHLSEPVDIVSTVVTRLEIPRLRDRVHAIDPNAFIVTSIVREAVGGILRRRSNHSPRTALRRPAN